MTVTKSTSYVSQRRVKAEMLKDAIVKHFCLTDTKVKCQDWEEKTQGMSKEAWRPFWMTLSVEQTIASEPTFSTVVKFEMLVSGKWRGFENETKLKDLLFVKASPENADEVFNDMPF